MGVSGILFAKQFILIILWDSFYLIPIILLTHVL